MPRNVWVYFLLWGVRPTFAALTKNATKHVSIGETLVTVYGVRPTFAYHRVQDFKNCLSPHTPPRFGPRYFMPVTVALPSADATSCLTSSLYR